MKLSFHWMPWRHWRWKKVGYEHGPLLGDHTFGFLVFSVFLQGLLLPGAVEAHERGGRRVRCRWCR